MNYSQLHKNDDIEIKFYNWLSNWIKKRKNDFKFQRGWVAVGQQLSRRRRPNCPIDQQ